MKYILISIIIAIILPIKVQALTTIDVYSDSLGYTHYNFDDGTKGLSWKDSLGYMQFKNLDDGSSGSAYTDVLGYTHYSFDTTNNQSQTTQPQSNCHIDYKAFICIEENQFQEVYNKASDGIPKAGTLLSPEQEIGIKTLYGYLPDFNSPESRENLIMNGEYGSWLKICRNSLELYKTTKTNYDRCIQEENNNLQKYAKARLDLMIKQAETSNENNKIKRFQSCIDTAKATNQTPAELNMCMCGEGKTFDPKSFSCIQTTESKCGANSAKNQNGECACNVNFVLNKTATACVKCEEEWPNSRYDTINDKHVCFCNNGYTFNKTTNNCQKNNPAIELPTKATDRTDLLVPTENKTIKIIPKNIAPIKKSAKDDMQPSTNTAIINLKTDVNTTTEQKPKIDIDWDKYRERISSTTVKTGIFQKVGEKFDNTIRKMSNFFTKISTKIKFW